MGQSTDFPNALTIPVIIPANAQAQIPFLGTTVRCLDSTGAFKVSFNNSSSGIELNAGLSYSCPEGVEFSRITLKNETGSAITAKLFLGRGEMGDSRLNVLGGTIGVKNEAAGTLYVSPYRPVFWYGSKTVNTDTAVLVSNGYGGGFLLRNVGAAPIYLSYYGAAAVVDCIYTLNPGESYDWNLDTNVYACCDTGFSSVLKYLQVKRPNA